MKTQGVAARLRIAFVADTIDDGYGGGVVSAERFVAALREQHQVTVVATGSAGVDRVSLRTLMLPLHVMRAMRFRLAVPNRKRLRGAFENADVVHLQFPFWASFRALRLAREMGLPVVAAFHVQPENILQNIGWNTRWPVLALYRFWVKRFYNRADLVVCPSELARQALLDAGLERPTRVISNGVPRSLIETPEPMRECAMSAPRTLLMVGRLASEKQHGVVFEALRRCRSRGQVKLLIAGAGPLEGELRRQIRQQPQIEFLGYVSDERLAELYRQADLLVHASDVELEGMVVLEAMAHGLPVLVSDSPRSAAKQFTISDAYRFRNGDPIDLAQKLDSLLDDAKTLVQSRALHIEKAKGYVFEESVGALIRAYRDVIDRARRQRVVIESVPSSATKRRDPAWTDATGSPTAMVYEREDSMVDDSRSRRAS